MGGASFGPDRPREDGRGVPLGRVLATPGVLLAVPPDELLAALDRHARGDWGDIDDDDREQNERGLVAGCRVLSVYKTTAGVVFWVITEADRASTTALMPEEY